MWIVVAKYLIPKGFSGVTLFPFIFLKETKLVYNKSVIQHEKIHLRQQIELLILPFYLWYLLEFLYRYLQHRNLHLAYRAICFEREAYANEWQIDYLKHRKLWNFTNYL